MQVVTQEDPIFRRTLADFSLAYDLSEHFGEDYAAEQMDLLCRLHPEWLDEDDLLLIVATKEAKRCAL